MYFELFRFFALLRNKTDLVKNIDIFETLLSIIRICRGSGIEKIFIDRKNKFGHKYFSNSKLYL